jgi:hypothetical protein
LFIEGRLLTAEVNVVRNERVRLETEHSRLLEERRSLAVHFARDRLLVLTLHTELNGEVRPLSDALSQRGIELLLRLHETSARLVELDVQLAKYRSH